MNGKNHPARHFVTSESLSLIIASSLIIVGMGGCIVSSIMGDFILLFAFVEVASVAMFFILTLSMIPAYFPDKVKADSIFYCGLGKEPYVSDEEVYRTNVPLLNTPYDTNWDNYYDKRFIKLEGS